MRYFKIASVAIAAALSVGCGLSSSLIPGVDDTDDNVPVDASTVDAPTDGPVFIDAPKGPKPVEAGPVVEAGTPPVEAGTPPVEAGTPPVEAGVPEGGPHLGRTLPEAGDDSGEGDDGSVVVVVDSGSGDDATTVGDDATTVGDDASDDSSVDASTPVADAAPQCYTVCDNNCESCKWVCTSAPGCTDTQRESCSLQCTTVQGRCHTVCDTHGCGGYGN